MKRIRQFIRDKYIIKYNNNFENKGKLIYAYK